jgi:hypothetical protein
MNYSSSVSLSTISGINQLAIKGKRDIYSRLVPPELVKRLGIPVDFIDTDESDLLVLDCPPGSTSTELSLFHQAGFPDPVQYGHITDTLNGQIHVLLYVLNDPASPRFDVDRLPDGSLTNYGTHGRNLDAEIAALEYGLAPGQIRHGLRLLGAAIRAFETFVESLGHDLYFVEPLYYHNAVIFEGYGFNYEKGRRFMERIQAGFAEGGDLLPRLDGSSPFRQPKTGGSIRLRSWAIHDGILGEAFTNVTMYKHIGKSAGVATCQGCTW